MIFNLFAKKEAIVFTGIYDGRTTVVPVHPCEDIKKGLFLEILKDIEISPEEFLKLL